MSALKPYNEHRRRQPCFWLRRPAFFLLRPSPTTSKAFSLSCHHKRLGGPETSPVAGATHSPLSKGLVVPTGGGVGADGRSVEPLSEISLLLRFCPVRCSEVYARIKPYTAELEERACALCFIEELEWRLSMCGSFFNMCQRSSIKLT